MRPLELHPYLAPFRARLGSVLEGTQLLGPDEMSAVFEGHRRAHFPEVAPLRFVAQAPGRTRRRRDEPIDPDDSYDGAITVHREVPTRVGDVHDFFNFVLWCCLPRTKAVVHARQLAARRDWIPAGATRIPGRRTREQDALTLFDEGGMVGTVDGPRLVFGHAVLEHFCTSDAEVAVTWVDRALPPSLEATDVALAAWAAEPDSLRAPHTARPTLLDARGVVRQR